MLHMRRVTDTKGQLLIEDPPVARYLFQSTGLMAFIWLLVRLFVGYQWIDAGWEKFKDPAWMGGSGDGIMAFWQRAVAIPATGKPPITYDWYRGFLQFLMDANTAPWFSKVIVFGELGIGVAMIVGAFVGLVAVGGLVMNMAFLLAGSASINPVLALIEIALILAWKNAGFLGLDRYLLPVLGTPWRQPNLQERPRSKLRAAA